MTTLRWYIAPELELLRRPVGQAARQLAKARLEPMAAPQNAPVQPQPWQPTAALQDRGDRYELQLQLPGISADDLDIEASRDRIHIRGQRPGSEGKVIHSEFRTGPFERSIALTEEIQQQQVSARLERGMLSLTLPKRSAAQDDPVPVVIGTTADQSPTAATSAAEASAPVAPLPAEASVNEDVWAEQAA